MSRFENSRKVIVVTIAALALASCDSGGGSTPIPTPPVSLPAPPPPPGSGSVTISGTVTFDSVPLNPVTNGLNYSGTTQQPARGIVVEAINSAGSVLATSITDELGQYALAVTSNTSVRVRATARIQKSGSPGWDVAVRNNTSANALYTLNGNLTSSGTTDSTRNLNAPSGWTGTSYSQPRTAAPFAILDPVYEAIQDIVGAAPSTNFPLLQVFWSVNNRSADGDVTVGEIGSTSYTRISNVPTVLVLGNANNDTDEYDSHVITHEYGHYLEDQLSRSDSVGGSHGLSDRLDPRVAFSEGFGNAFSGLVLGDQFYRDTSGPQQAQGFSINLESNSIGQQGWYGESSVQSILYDIGDADDDGADNISAGLGTIYNVLASQSYIDSPAPITIFNFAETLRVAGTVNNTDLNGLLSAQNINGTGNYGDGETNGGGITGSLPVVKTVSIGGGALNFCSIDDAGDYNKLGNRHLIRFNVPVAQSLTFTMTRTSGPSGRDPDFLIFQAGDLVAVGGSAATDSEVLTENIAAGNYWLEAYDFFNVDDSGPTGDVCYDFTVN